MSSFIAFLLTEKIDVFFVSCQRSCLNTLISPEIGCPPTPEYSASFPTLRATTGLHQTNDVPLNTYQIFRDCHVSTSMLSNLSCTPFLLRQHVRLTPLPRDLSNINLSPLLRRQLPCFRCPLSRKTWQHRKASRLHQQEESTINPGAPSTQSQRIQQRCSHRALKLQAAHHRGHLV